MVTPLDILETMAHVMKAIRQEAGGEVLRATSPEGVEVFVHVAPDGETNQVTVSGDPVRDLFQLKAMVTPQIGLADA